MECMALETDEILTGLVLIISSTHSGKIVVWSHILGRLVGPAGLVG